MIEQIAQRLVGLRESVGLTPAEIAVKCNVSATDYEQYESGKVDIPVGFLCEIAQIFGIEPTALISGAEAHVSTYFVTRKGKGVSVERSKAYKYQDLASGFKNAKSTPFIVTVEPNDKPISLNSHAGQEFNLMLRGKLLLEIDGKEIILEEGDSIYFDATKQHGMKALDNEKARFLAIII